MDNKIYHFIAVSAEGRHLEGSVGAADEAEAEAVITNQYPKATKIKIDEVVQNG